MPYVTSERTNDLDNGGIPLNVGDLTYLVTRELQKGTGGLRWRLQETIRRWTDEYGTNSYSYLAQVVAAIECACLEHVRRVHLGAAVEATMIAREVMHDYYYMVVAPYEDKKIEENGDVYGCA